MCGLVGFVGSHTSNPYPAKRGDWFEQALFADTFRGPDSTGVFTVSEKGQVYSAKKAMWAPDFISTRAYRSIKGTFADAQMIIGHNRKATQGKVNQSNAHPFTVGHITLVHNGSLSASWRTDLSVTNKGFEVDSQAIAYALSIAPAEEVIPKIRGAFALIWWDDKAKTLNIVRNDERPLYIAYPKDRREEYFMLASEGEMITWLAERNNYEIKDPYILKEGSISSFALDDLALTQREVKLATPFASRTTYTNTTTHGTGNTAPALTATAKGLSKWNLRENSRVTFELTGTTKMKNHNSSDILGDAIYHSGLQVAGRSVSNDVVSDNRAHAYTGEVYGHYHSGKAVVCLVRNVKPSTLSKSAIKAAKRRTKRREDTGGSNVTHFPSATETFPGPQGIHVPRDTMRHVVKNGCGVCGDPILSTDYGSLKWYGSDPICWACQDSDIYKKHLAAEAT
jgi:predicted glutamine amidotransferase